MKVRFNMPSISLRYFSLFLLASVPSVAQAPGEHKPKSEPLAVVDGQTISQDDLFPYIQGLMFPLRQQEFEVKSNALENLINLRLLDGQAKKMGITTGELIELEINAKVAEPTESELQALYIVQKDQLGKLFPELRTPLQRLLKQARIQQAREDYYKRLREKATVSVLLEKPSVAVAHDPARLRGDPKASLVIVEFSDFQCGYCRSVEATLKKLLSKYDGQVSLAYRDLPLREIHPQAQLAAEAGRCAGEQGRFWEYHDVLFENQNKLNREDLAEHARTVKLDEKKFDSCLASGKYKPEIEQERQLGLKAGVTGTPGFFINGKLLTGNLPQDSFEKFIQEALAAAPKEQARRID